MIVKIQSVETMGVPMNAEKILTKRGRFIAIYEMIAGAAGFLIALSVLFKEFSGGRAVDIIVGVVLIGLSALTLIAGILFIKGKPLALWLSLIVQLLQLPMLMLKGLHYYAFILFSLGLGAGAAGDVLLNYYAGVGMFFKIGTGNFEFAGVNLIALLILILLPRSLKNRNP
ncbi:hypothetical protein ACFL42_00365 [Candidatus Omnitrophota bacterium]